MAAITKAEITLHPALAMNQTETTGGVINNSITIVDLQKGVLKDITAAQRVAGGEFFYKLFQKIGNIDNKIYGQAAMFLGDALQNDYVISLRAGSFTDVQSDVAAARNYGCGYLAVAVNANEQTIVINTRGATYAHFQNGDLICITDYVDVDDITGNVEFAHIDEIPTWNGDECTIHIDTPLGYNYTTTRTVDTVEIRTRIASCIEFGDVIGSITTSDKTSAHGTVDETQVVPNSIAGISQTMTISFVSGLDFNVVSNVAGLTLPNGQKTTDYEPQNDDYILPYLTIPASFWTNDGAGDWVAGDTVKIHTNPCAMPFWIVIDVPSNSEASDLEIVNPWCNGTSGSS